jgi:hypothetical protein
LLLCRFAYLDPLRGRWLRARYVLGAPAIRCRYGDYATRWRGCVPMRRFSKGIVRFPPSFARDANDRKWPVSDAVLQTTDCGIVRPSTSVVLKLMTNSNCLGCPTG